MPSENLNIILRTKTKKDDLPGLWYNPNMWEDVHFTNRLPTGELDADP